VEGGARSPQYGAFFGPNPVPLGPPVPQGGPNNPQQVNAVDTYTPTSSYSSGGSGSGSSYTPADIAYLRGIKQNYLDQQGRIDTGQTQGMKRIADDYGREVQGAETDKTNQLNKYKGQREDQTTTKGQNYSKINQGANRGYNSLAAILGRASGTGSSAFQKLLPNVIGKDIYSKRSEANQIFGENMQNIDESQGEYLNNFARVLDDLKRQKDQNEENLLSGVNTQRADIASKLGTVEGQLAAAQGGGEAQIRAAQAPYDAQVTSARDAIDNLFNTYFRPFTPQVANAPAPELGQYTMDRSQINAGNRGLDPTNPYGNILRKKLQESAI